MPVEGYEIHMGTTCSHTGDNRSVVQINSINGKNSDITDGLISGDGYVWGSYLHGLFDNPVFRAEFLKQLKPALAKIFQRPNMEIIEEFRDRQYELLADHFEKNLDMDKILQILAI